MKKYIIFSFILGLMFTACNPNKDIYDDIKNNEKPYSETGLEYTFTQNDYATVKSLAEAASTNEEDSAWASYILKYSSFNDKFTAYKYIPQILADNFPALKEGSNCNVTFNQYIGEMFGKITTAVLNDNDYIDMGGDIAANLYFSQESDLDNLPTYLLNKFSNPETNDFTEVFYRYPDINTIAGSFFKFNGFNWVLYENSIVLAPNDYAQMGEPVSLNNYFSEDAKPNNYLPQFLKLYFPYAQEGDEKTIVCHILNYESLVYAILCKYDGADWTVNFPGEESVLQFKHNDEKWYFDPTVTMTMMPSDYQLIVDFVAGSSEIPAGYLDEFHPENTEYYYGANSYYANFYTSLNKRRQYDPLGLLTGLSDE